MIKHYYDMLSDDSMPDSFLESKEFLKAFAQALPDVVFIIDEDGRYVEVLPPQNQPHKGRRLAMRGHLVSEILPPEVAVPVMDTIRRTFTTGEPQVLEYARQIEDLVNNFHLHRAQMSKEVIIRWTESAENILRGESEVWKLTVLRGQTATEEALNQLVNSQSNSLQSLGKLAGTPTTDNGTDTAATGQQGMQAGAAQNGASETESTVVSVTEVSALEVTHMERRQ